MMNFSLIHGMRITLDFYTKSLLWLGGEGGGLAKLNSFNSRKLK